MGKNDLSSGASRGDGDGDNQRMSSRCPPKPKPCGSVTWFGGETLPLGKLL